MTDSQRWVDLIDNYHDTIYAMVGFGNLYRYDDERQTMCPTIGLLQGWRFDCRDEGAGSGEGQPKDVAERGRPTPDLAILLGEEAGVVAEVKRSFPQNRDYWAEDFDQLLKYDWELTGWPTPSGRVKQYDLVLLTHQSRSFGVRDYYMQARSRGQYSFGCPFVIVEFNRSDERQPYFFFRRTEGELSEKKINERLREGVPVPMAALLTQYSMVKVYDSEPPLPYFLQVIWQEVIAPKAYDKLPNGALRRKQRVEVDITVDQLTQELRDKFSFKVLWPRADDRQPLVPEREWVHRACKSLVSQKLAEWEDGPDESRLRVFFQVLDGDDLLEEFISFCGNPASSGSKQQGLFEK